VLPAIGWEVSRVLKVMTQAGATVSLLHGEFCGYGIHMEWFQGTLFFMRGWEAMVNKLFLKGGNSGRESHCDLLKMGIYKIQGIIKIKKIHNQNIK
jgi:hypothetical protein